MSLLNTIIHMADRVDQFSSRAAAELKATQGMTRDMGVNAMSLAAWLQQMRVVEPLRTTPILKVLQDRQKETQSIQVNLCKGTNASTQASSTPRPSRRS
jgi:hypothetical protein